LLGKGGVRPGSGTGSIDGLRVIRPCKKKFRERGERRGEQGNSQRVVEKRKRNQAEKTKSQAAEDAKWKKEVQNQRCPAHAQNVLLAQMLGDHVGRSKEQGGKGKSWAAEKTKNLVEKRFSKNLENPGTSVGPRKNVDLP